MNVTTEEKKELFKKFGKSENDTGSTEAQAALFTLRIQRLTDHLREHSKDHSTRLGLLKLVGKRRDMLNYLMKKDITKYRALIKELNLRK